MQNCIVCGQQKLVRVIELGLHPPADTFIAVSNLSNPQVLLPLNCQLCRHCGHLQNEFVVPREARYISTDYSYTASNSKISCEHWTQYAEEVSSQVGLQVGDPVIEFGSNDGYLLKRFFEKGAKVMGIDPSPYLCHLALTMGVETHCGFLGQEAMAKAVAKNGKAKIICGNNVFNHIDNLEDVVPAIKSGLRDDGVFIFESPYCLDIIKNYYFDTIYHEHLSYFSAKSVSYLLRKHGLFITKIEKNSYHGGCLRVYSSPNTESYNSALVEKMIGEEESFELFSEPTYKNYMNKVKEDKFLVLSQIYSLKKNGKRLAAVGAAARGNTLLNFYGLDSDTITFVTDNSEHKIGKFTPGSCIPIVPDAELSRDIDVALILSWNIGQFLVEKIRRINSRLQFIVPGEKELM